jgi:UDP:flavonoid glycosyltransferase YjiC (YdhE family)
MYTYGDFTVYADVPALVPTYDLPASHRYIGPVLWSPAVDLPDWWADLPSDRPIVYVTPGSSGESEFASVVLEALADMPVTVLVATAGRTRLEGIPSNARVADFLPGTEAAGRAALVISNGGSPTTWQALAAGVPVLGIASNNMDQHLNMTAVRHAGAGELLRARGLRPAPLRTLVTRMLDAPRYRTAAAALALARRRYEPESRFPALIQEVLEKIRTPGSLSAPR